MDMSSVQKNAAANNYLRDAEIAERIAAYNGDGILGKQLELIWDRASELILATVEEYWTPKLDDIYRSCNYDPEVSASVSLENVTRNRSYIHSHPIDAQWINALSMAGIVILQFKIPLAQAVVDMAAESALIADRIAEHFSDERRDL